MENSLHCQNCGSVLTTQALCGVCKSKLPFIPLNDPKDAVSCNHCRAPNHKSARFCYACGTGMDSKQKARQQPVGQTSLSGINPELHRKLEEAIQAVSSRGGNPMTTSMNEINTKSIRFALWGPAASGKTTYLLSLYHASKKGNSPYLVQDDIEDASIDTNFENLWGKFKRGDFPPATQVGLEKPDVYNLIFFPRNQNKAAIRLEKRQKDILDKLGDWLSTDASDNNKSEKDDPLSLAISFSDVAGEDYLNAPLTSPLWKHLTECNGLICLLDPHLEEEEMLSHLDYTRKLIKSLYKNFKEIHPGKLLEGRYLPQFVYICFTKMDRPELKNYIDKPEEIPAIMEEVCGLNFMNDLLIRFDPKRIRYHSISSVGMEVQQEGVKIINPKMINPYHVFDPFDDWILHS